MAPVRSRLVCVLLSLSATAAGAEGGGRLVFDVPAGAHFSFGGRVGERIQRNVDAWLLPAPLANPGMLAMFRLRDSKPEPQIVPWAGEFAGKYLISAIQALRETDRPDLQKRVEEVVGDLISAQAEDGYLGPFPRRERLLGHWDLWGHYHVMQALLLWHEETGAEAALRAATRAADLICDTYLDAGRRVFDAGSPEMNMAVIHVLGALHRRTGNPRYLGMAREIEKDWERAGDYFRLGLQGVDFYRTPRPRWESLHDLQGLVELYRITGDVRYRAAFVNLWRSIARRDRHNTGGFSSGEQAVGHPYSPAPIETCCTIAWMAITIDMLRLTGDSRAADELELSTLNGALGAQHPSGRWWTYNTPMDGSREASAHSIVFQARAGAPELNCCSVNGPRALGMLSEWAVLVAPEGPVVSYYGPLKASLKLAGRLDLSLEEETDYPAGAGPIRIVLHPARTARFTLKLRIPGWSSKTVATSVDGPLAGVKPGSYLEINREWKDGDWVELKLDPRLRVWVGDREQAGRVSLFRGPLLLAWDQVASGIAEESLPALDASTLRGATARPLEVRGSRPGGLSPWVLLSVPAPNGAAVVLTDFASAGAEGNRYRSWLPAVNAPPPPVLLDRPGDGAAIPAGKAVFSWRRGRGADGHTLLFSTDPDFASSAAHLAGRSGRLVLDPAGEPGRDLFWKVVAKNGSGASESEVQSFRVDPSLPRLAEAALAAGSPTADGLLVSAPLKGDVSPSHGVLLDARGFAPAPGPSGAAGAAVAFDGEKGRARYAVPDFPGRDYTAVVRVAPRAFPPGRIAQVLSAWAAPVDDPLRITVEGGKLFARIESGRGFSTAGVELAPGRWIHVAAVKSGVRLSLYIDGELKASADAPEEIVTAAESLALGGNPNFDGNEFLPASLADFAFYARALSPEEVRKLSDRP